MGKIDYIFLKKLYNLPNNEFLETGNKLFNKNLKDLGSPNDRAKIAFYLDLAFFAKNNPAHYENVKDPFDEETKRQINKIDNEFNPDKINEDEIKQRIAFENVFNNENEITNFTLIELYRLVKSLTYLQQMGRFNFYTPAEIGAYFLIKVCKDYNGEENKQKIKDIANILCTETTTNFSAFKRTLELFEKYLIDYNRTKNHHNHLNLRDLKRVSDHISSRDCIRHNFPKKSLYESYTPTEFLPQVLSREVYVKLNEYLNPNNENELTPPTTTEPPTSGKELDQPKTDSEFVKSLKTLHQVLIYLSIKEVLQKVIADETTSNVKPKTIDVVNRLKTLNEKKKYFNHLIGGKGISFQSDASLGHSISFILKKGFYKKDNDSKNPFRKNSFELYNKQANYPEFEHLKLQYKPTEN